MLCFKTAEASPHATFCLSALASPPFTMRVTCKCSVSIPDDDDAVCGRSKVPPASGACEFSREGLASLTWAWPQQASGLSSVDAECRGWRRLRVSGRLQRGGEGRARAPVREAGAPSGLPPPPPQTAANGGNGSTGRAVNGDQPIGTAGCRREPHTMATPPLRPPSENGAERRRRRRKGQEGKNNCGC